MIYLYDNFITLYNYLSILYFFNIFDLENKYLRDMFYDKNHL